MTLTRRDFLKDIAFAALVGVPDWAAQLDELPAMVMTSPPAFPWQWSAPSAPGSPTITALNRVAFGPRPGDFERDETMGVDAYIEEQLYPETIDDRALEKRLASAYPTLSKSAGELMRDYPRPQPGATPAAQKGPQEVVNQLQEATVLRAILSQRQLQEVLVDFWSNHFNIFIGKNDVRWLKTVDDREVIRKHAFGKFSDLLLASAQSPAMLEYLDNRQNVKGVPNENYAREIMELHSLGVDGGYTHHDVEELARALTGWAIRPPRKTGPFGAADYADAGTFVFEPKRHDDGAKHVLGVDLPAGGGIGDGLKMIDVLAHHPTTARFVSKRLVTRLVSDNPPDSLVLRAAETFKQSDGDIRAVLGTILHSDEFKNSFAQKIKRPFELVVSTARALDMQVDDTRALTTALRLMGQGIFLHLTPDGYPDNGAAWINTSGLLARWNLALLAASNKVPQARVDLQAAMSGANIRTVGDAIDFWTNYLLHRPLPDADRQKLVDAAGGNARARVSPARIPDLVALILASPHFQYK